MSLSETQHVTQMTISNPMEANRIFETDYGANIPIVLVPNYPSCCHLCLNVPDGVYVLYQKWNKHMGLLDAGVKWFWPAFNRISHIVTRKSKTYSHPVTDCPTKDNVMVQVDLSLTFQIQNPEDFVYRLGAHRFDEYLSCQTDEAIRGLVHSVTHDKVLDLREEFAQGLIRGLRSKLLPFGVNISNVKITQVQLPAALAKTLQNTTAFKTKMEEQKEQQVSKKREITDKAKEGMTQIMRNNARQGQELSAARDRCLIRREEEITEAENRKNVSSITAQQKAATSITKAEARLKVGKLSAEQSYEELMRNTNADCSANKVRIEQQVRTNLLDSAADLKHAEARAGGVLADAEAEEKAIEDLKEARILELRKKKIDTIVNFALSGKMLFNGENGERILNSVYPSGEKKDFSVGKDSTGSLFDTRL
eukprot:TRINITY_DN3569_c0_g1_i1.p1 TRINITY_DN3569_c0_g1~~TRINITY_DN3569_c0_g1_i1.p1  ORF type:complete len:423 (+),score=159.74 TRINITY_DN3569_c0_g1_i1:105-1373(+)